MEAEAFGVLFGTEDGREGLAAFVAKRPAQFKGR
jgi:enoyl-CoA hydratase